MKQKLSILLNGIVKENPTFVLLLGTCPTLATTTSAVNGLGMGISTMIVLICSNLAIALLKNAIPDKVRIPCYIVLIAGFVTIVGFLLEAYAPGINDSLGIFISLIVVNCIILGRAEMFAARNGVADSVFDGIGMGLGFTGALFIMGAVREILGNGTIFGVTLTADLFPPMSIFALAPGAFFTFGCLIALINHISNKRHLTIKRQEMTCAGCPMITGCLNKGKNSCSGSAAEQQLEAFHIKNTAKKGGKTE